MKQRATKTLALVAILTALSYSIPKCLSDGYSLSYQLLDRPSGSAEYKLNVVVPQSLYEYYREKDHKQVSVEDFARFVTPHALKPIADKLLELYQNDEENFANGVLMIVHQIPYTATKPAKYPAETLVENSGDCDLLSYIAASTMKAGGLDTILLYYKDKTHMNIGVHLSKSPRDARTPAYYVIHNGVQYYIAECTGENLKDGWRVGECPGDLKHEEAQIITLENCEQWALGQVSASYKTLKSSTITLTASPTFVLQGNRITLSGQLSPNLQNKTVTIYFKIGNAPWTMLAMVTTDSNGRFTYILNVNETSLHYIRANWSGDNDYAGDDSPIISITALSTFFIKFLTIILALVCASAMAFLMARQKHPEMEETQVPEASSL